MFSTVIGEYPQINSIFFLLIQNAVLSTDKRTVDKHIWKCVDYNKRESLGRVWTDGDKVVYENEKHNHVPDVVEIGVKQVLAGFKNRRER